MKLYEILESASAGSTSSGNVASVISPHISPGKARGKKSYIGSPGRSGTKSPPQPAVADNTGKNALDSTANIFGQNVAIKR
jgi:hypothetical protein